MKTPAKEAVKELGEKSRASVIPSFARRGLRLLAGISDSFTRSIACAALLICLIQSLGFAEERSSGLVFAERPKLINCDPATSIPGFRAKLNFVDATGNPLSVELPKAQDLPSNVFFSVDGQGVPAFFASAEGDKQSVKSRVALLVIDVSGSMNALLPGGGSRFQAAKNAAFEFLRNFENGVDRIAIVPFASREVEPTIRAAVFVKTADEARKAAGRCIRMQRRTRGKRSLLPLRALWLSGFRVL